MIALVTAVAMGLSDVDFPTWTYILLTLSIILD